MQAKSRRGYDSFLKNQEGAGYGTLITNNYNTGKRLSLASKVTSGYDSFLKNQEGGNIESCWNGERIKWNRCVVTLNLIDVIYKFSSRDGI